MRNQLRRLPDCISPISAIFIVLAIFPPLIVILKPTLKEFLVFLFVDTFAFFINQRFEGKLFTSLFPDTAVYFDRLDEDQVEKMSFEEKHSLCQSFSKFPKRRAVYCYLESYLKTLPALLIMGIYWKHEIPTWQQSITILGVTSICFTYFAGAVFIESHIFLSEKITTLHRKFNFSDIFRNTAIQYSRTEFEIQQIILLGFIIFFMLALQLTVLLTHQYSSVNDLALKLGTIACVTLALFTRLWYLDRSHFVRGLERIFENLQTLDFQKVNPTLSLHTSPLLAQFEKSYNELTARLEASEKKLASIIITEVEKSRYRAIGEMSALIAHDLSGPLHSASFYVNELKEVHDSSKLQAFIERISVNLGRAIELIASLRAKLKNSSNRPSETSFLNAHQHVARLFRLQFSQFDFNQLQFVLDPRLSNVNLILPSTDLIHILDNIYRNSIEDFLKYSISKPLISVKLEQLDEHFAQITIQDNGSGLSPERYEELTSSIEPLNVRPVLQQSLGLRLTRRLVELNKGSLTVARLDNLPGTVFNLRLQSNGGANV
jgi:signal transduction histidine kinase